MKKRIIALVLAMVSLFTVAPASVFTVDAASGENVVGRTAKFTTQYPYVWSDPTNAASQLIVRADELPEKVRIVGVYTYGSSTVLYELEAADGSAWPEAYKNHRYVESTKLELLPEEYSKTVSIVDADGNPISSQGLYLAQGQSTRVAVPENFEPDAVYQWQICYNNADMLWVDLYGANEKQLRMSCAMLRNVVDYYGKTYVRCAVTVGREVRISDPVPVSVIQAAFQKNTTRVQTQTGTQEPALTDSTVKYAITVLFKYADTEQVWTSYLAQGQDYILDIECPTIPGYVPENGQTRVTENIVNIQSNVTIVVQYVPDYVDFVVEHYWQYVDKDEYELHETQTVSGLKTGEFVGANLHKTYTGFDHLNYDSEITVAADGSTVVKIYYDREYYMVSVDLNGGHGSEPVCARYGTPIVVPDPQRKGYAFAGWLYDQTGVIRNDLPATVPAYNTSYTAQWTKANTKFTVAFWYENANDTDYAFAGSARIDGLTGDKVNGYDYRNVAFTGRNDSHFTYKSADSNVEIKADGSAVVNVYFSRNTYLLEYYTYNCLHVNNGQHTTACCSLQHIHNQTSGRCCSIHVHTMACLDTPANGGYEPCANSSYEKKCREAYPNPVNGQMHSFWNILAYRYFVYFDGVWYQVKNNSTYGIEWGSCGGNPTTPHAHGNGCNTSGCGKTAHDHSAGKLSTCNTGACSHVAKVNADNTWSCGCSNAKDNPGRWVKTYSAYHKYDSNVGYIHRQMEGETKGYRLVDVVMGGKETGEFPGVSEGAMGTFTAMPGGYTAIYRSYNGSNKVYKMIYWLETYDGTGTRTFNGKNYKQGDIFYANMAFVGWEGDYLKGIPLGYKAYMGTAGDTDNSASATDNNTEFLTEQTGLAYAQYQNLYYDLEDFPITYFNVDDPVATRQLYYNQPLTSQYDLRITDMVSPYGKGYTFSGWYLDNACTVPVSWGSTRMPDGGMAVWAKWDPVLHKVTTYLTKDGQALNSYEIYHENTVSAAVSEPVRAGYNFVGWFYEDENGTEHAYDFSMPVYKDMQLYAKWTSDTFVTGKIYYKDAQGNLLADFTPIRGSVGDTKTYSAKVGTALNLAPAGVTYFPNVTSHSVTFSAQTAQNDFTFLYTAKEKVSYRVHFVDADTGAQVAATVTGESRSASLVFDLNEQNITVKKYTVDAMRKTFALSADDSLNEFYFYFTKDEENATVQVEHYIQNTAGTDYILYFTEPTSKALIGSTVTANALTINGFTYDPGAADAVNGVVLPDTGIILKLYYTRNSYPYQFRFVYLNDKGQEVEFSDSRVSGTALYGVTVNQVAKSFAGYKLTSAGSMSITVAAEDPAADANSRIFYYEENQVTIRYQPGAGGGGTVSTGSESVKAITGQAQGSTATANAHYEFKGWYSNFACDDANLVWADATFVPAKDGVYTAVTYYAKFEEEKVNIHYGVIMPDGAKATAVLSAATEAVSILTGRAEGSRIVSVPAGYTFEGWYDADGNQLSAAANWTPSMPGEMWVDGTTFYAKFVESTVTVTMYVNAFTGGTVQLGTDGTPVARLEQTVNAWTGTMEDVIAVAAEGYHFAGWYKDGELISLDPVLQLRKDEDRMWEDGTYTAEFAPDVADLTIRTTCDEPEQSFVFDITGPDGLELTVVLVGNDQQKILDLPVGSYVVTERTDWSWRQTDVAPQTVDITQSGQILEFHFGAAEDDRWLSGMDTGAARFEMGGSNG